MKFRILCLCTLCAFAAAISSAQQNSTKMTMTGTCSKPDTQQSVPAGDKEGHMFSISQGKCTVKGDIGGAKGKDGVWADHGDGTAAKAKVNGVFTETLDSGDKVYYSYSETTMMKDGVPQSATNSYQIAGGTGKMKGIKGSGTCKLTGTGDGGMNFTCSGVYMMGATQ